MPDIRSIWQASACLAAWALDGPDLATGDDLETAVILSLFTDRRADPDDIIPDGSRDPRGWWGDLGADVPIGSKLWLLDRAKATEQVRLRAEDYIGQALQWLVDDGVAAAVEVSAAWQKPLPGVGFLAAAVTISEPTGRTRVFNYQWAWGGVS